MASKKPLVIETTTADLLSQFQAADTLDVDGSAVFNESGGDKDFRVEGDTRTHMIFVDASAATENVALAASSAPNWQSMDGGLFIADASAAPSGAPTGGIFLWAESGELKAEDSAGNVTTLTNPSGGGSGTDTQSLTNGEATAIVVGTPVYISAADTVLEAQANATSTSRVIGLVEDASIAASAAGNVQTDGVATATTTQWDAVTGGTGGLTAGSVYYLDPATAGMLTTTAPSTVGQVVAPIGVALSTTEFRIRIEQTVLL